MKKQRIFLMTLILSVALLFTGCPELETSESNRNNSGEQTSVQLTDETEHTKSSVHTNDNPTLATTKAKESTTAETEPSEEPTTTEPVETTAKKSKSTTEATQAPTTEAPPKESTTVKETTKEPEVIVVPGIVDELPVTQSEPAETKAPSSGGGGGGGSGSGADYWFDFAYVANANSKKFHRAGCSSIGDMSDSNKIGYNSAQEAIDDGFVPCKRCHPENDI